MADIDTSKSSESSIQFGLVLNSLYTIVAFVFGLLTGSLALIATATDGLVDTFTLTIAFGVNRISKRPATDSKSFGYGRATILAALVNASIMVAVAGGIALEAIQRLNHPKPIAGGIVAVVALAGILVSSAIAYVLSKHRQDLNMRSIFVDNMVDALASLATMITGLIILVAHVAWLDTVVGLLIAVVLVYSAIKILKAAVHILLEGTPAGMDSAAVLRAIQATDKVLRVDDLHVWAIHSGYNALSCHIAVAETELPHSRDIVEAIKAVLRNSYNIQHATIEVELEDGAVHAEHERH